eukprot:13274106-Alexandrium_andersonii.AAC.1
MTERLVRTPGDGCAENRCTPLQTVGCTTFALPGAILDSGQQPRVRRARPTAPRMRCRSTNSRPLLARF